MRCIECGCFCWKIGNVPPETFECKHCGELFRATEENKIKSKARVDREKTDGSADHYPKRIEPSFAKIHGLR